MSARWPTCTSSCSRPAQAGAAVLLISEDLDEILSLADRIAVMHARAAHRSASARPMDAGDARPGDGRRRPPRGGGARAQAVARCALSARAQTPRVAVAGRAAGGARLHAGGHVAAGRLGRRAGGARLCAAARRRLRLALRVDRDPDPRDAVDPHRTGRRGGVSRAAVQHRRRRPALRRRAGGGGGGRAARRRRLVAAGLAAVSVDDRSRRARPARCCCWARRAARCGSASTRW